MSRTYRNYPLALKLALVRLVTEEKRSVRAVAAEAGVNRTLLIYWLRKYANGELTDEVEPIAEVGVIQQQLRSLQEALHAITQEIAALREELHARAAHQSPPPHLELVRDSLDRRGGA